MDLSANPAKYRRTIRAAQVLQRFALVRGQRPRAPHRERAQPERTELDAPEPHHRMPEGRAVSLDLAVSSFAEGDLEPRGPGPCLSRRTAEGTAGPSGKVTPCRQRARSAGPTRRSTSAS